MGNHKREVLRAALVLLLFLLAVGAHTRLPSVKAVSWNTPVQVPANVCRTQIQLLPCIDTWSATSPDPRGRVWLVWEEKTQGANGTAGFLHVFYRLWTNGTWSAKQQVTTDTQVDQTPSIASLSNGTMMIAWSSNRTGTFHLFYRLYSGVASVPFATSAEIQLTSNPASDTQPSASQDRNGRIWVVWNRTNGINYKYYNGTTWSSDFSLPPALSTTAGARDPAIMQRKDGRMMIIWSSVQISTGNVNILYSTTDGTIQPLPSSGIPATAWTTPVAPVPSSTSDEKPALVQARNGTLFIFWQRPINSTIINIFWTSSTDNGNTWTAPVALAPTAADQFDVAAGQMSDHRVWVFWNLLGATSVQTWYTNSTAMNNIHDIGLTTLTPSSRFIRSGDSVNISVGVVNYGDYRENTTLTVQLQTGGSSPTTIKTMPVSLAAGTTSTIRFSWNSTQPYWGIWGRYNLTATLNPVPRELFVNQGDDKVSAGLVRISPLGDLDRDGYVDILDAARLAFAFGSTGPPLSPPSQFWDPEADLDHDGNVNIIDAATLAFYFGDKV